MWSILTGFLLSTIFENQTIELYKNNFSNLSLSMEGIFIGWLFQEYVKEEFHLNGGKYFMVNNEFRYRFLTQSLKILITFIVYPHLITCLELGTFLILFGLVSVILFSVLLPKYKLYKKTKQIPFHLNSIFKVDLKKILLFISFYIFFSHGVGKIYFWFDLFFILRPIIIIILFFLNIFFLCWLLYLLYIFFLNYVSKKIGFLLKIFAIKFYLFIFFVNIFCELIITEITNQNFFVENFFKEIFFKIILIL